MKGGHAKICEKNTQSRWNKQLSRPEMGLIWISEPRNETSVSVTEKSNCRLVEIGVREGTGVCRIKTQLWSEIKRSCCEMRDIAHVEPWRPYNSQGFYTAWDREHWNIWDQRQAGLNWLLKSFKMQIKQCWNTFESKNLWIKFLIIHGI